MSAIKMATSLIARQTLYAFLEEVRENSEGSQLWNKNEKFVSVGFDLYHYSKSWLHISAPVLYFLTFKA